MAASETKKSQVGNLLSIVTVIVALSILIGFATGNSAIIWFLLVVNFVFGPACLFFYLVEVKKGVFRDAENN